MKIEFEVEDYKTLLDILYIADWVINAYEIQENPDNARYRQFEQKMLALAGNFNLEEWVRRDQDGEFQPTQKFEEASQSPEFIDAYDNDTFWEELINRLAMRDFDRIYGETSDPALTLQEKLGKLGELRETYAAEFENNGLAHLSLTRSL